MFDPSKVQLLKTAAIAEGFAPQAPAMDQPAADNSPKSNATDKRAPIEDERLPGRPSATPEAPWGEPGVKATHVSPEVARLSQQDRIEYLDKALNSSESAGKAAKAFFDQVLSTRNYEARTVGLTKSANYQPSLHEQLDRILPK